MSKRTHLVMAGEPNGGKGTLAKILRTILEENGYSVTDVPMSSILRKEVPKSIEWMERGELVPDELVLPEAIRVITEAESDFLIYDGFPRKDTQVKPFLETVKGETVLILELNTPEEVAIQRAENRLICSNCGRSWSKTGKMRPMEPGKCDACGGKLIRRKDDEIIKERIQLHKKYMPQADELLNEMGVPRVTVDYRETEEKEIAKYLTDLGLSLPKSNT